MNPIRVLVVDDHAVVTRGISLLLSQEEGIEVVGEARDGFEALAKIRALSPDVVLLDLMMPKMDGLEVIRRLSSDRNRPRILVLTSFASEERIFPAIKAGAMGYLLKDSDPAELIQAIRDVWRGRTSLSPLVAAKLVKQLQEPPQGELTNEPLTGREMEVLKLVARGLSNDEIARRLQISETTARTHVSNVLGKLHLASRTQAALYALREGLASLEESDA